jgi:hypothetical protein
LQGSCSMLSLHRDDIMRHKVSTASIVHALMVLWCNYIIVLVQQFFSTPVIKSDDAHTIRWMSGYPSRGFPRWIEVAKLCLLVGHRILPIQHRRPRFRRPSSSVSSSKARRGRRRPQHSPLRRPAVPRCQIAYAAVAQANSTLVPQMSAILPLSPCD